MKADLAVRLALIFAIAAPLAADANGGTLRLARATAGPYLVSAWTQPDPPRVGRIDLSVAVMSPPAGEAVLDAQARASASRVAGQGTTAGTRLDRGAGGNLLLYHGNLELPVAGPWAVLIEVGGAAGHGSATFGLEVLPPRPMAEPLAIGLVALVLGGTLWWVRMRLRSR